MAKLRIFSGREVCRVLSQHGFEEIRQRGSHIILNWDPWKFLTQLKAINLYLNVEVDDWLDAAELSS